MLCCSKHWPWSRIRGKVIAQYCYRQEFYRENLFKCGCSIHLVRAWIELENLLAYLFAVSFMHNKCDVQRLVQSSVTIICCIKRLLDVTWICRCYRQQKRDTAGSYGQSFNFFLLARTFQVLWQEMQSMRRNFGDKCLLLKNLRRRDRILGNIFQIALAWLRGNTPTRSFSFMAIPQGGRRRENNNVALCGP